VNDDEERIALFLDYENLAIGARENLGGMAFDLKPLSDAIAERGRAIVRRAYADWLKFGEDGRMLTRHHVELIEIPQRMGTIRKNAADIKMAVDAIELAFARPYITTYVLGTGDSDFTPLVHKLRELNKRVIGVGIESSTSLLLPPACDEFLFYERLEGVEGPERRAGASRRRSGRGRRTDGADSTETAAAKAGAGTSDDGASDEGEASPVVAPASIGDLERLLAQTLSGLERSSGGHVRASALKRAVLRKVSTFDESQYGFRGFTELLRNLADRGIVELVDSAGLGDPEVHFPAEQGHDEPVFELLRRVVDEQATPDRPTPLSGLKNKLRRHDPEFSEKRFGFGGFLQFAKAAAARNVIEMAWDDDADDYMIRPVPGSRTAAPADVATATETTAPATVETEPATGVEETATARTPARRRRTTTAAATAAVPETEPAEEPPAEAPKRRTRATRATTEASVGDTGEAAPAAPKRRTTRRSSTATPAADGEAPADTAPASDTAPAPRRRTTQRKPAKTAEPSA